MLSKDDLIHRVGEHVWNCKSRNDKVDHECLVVAHHADVGMRVFGKNYASLLAEAAIGMQTYC